MVGITTMNNVTMQNITDIFNFTGADPTEFLINVNQIVFSGWFYFIMLWLIGFILFRRAQEKEDQPLINAMNVSAVLTIFSFFLRAVYVIQNGVQVGLLTDFQMWMFPLITVLLAGIVRYMGE